MVRSLLRAVILLIVVVAAAAYLLGWKVGQEPGAETAGPVGTSGASTERAREIGAEVGERTAVAANEARRALTDGQVTAKIKAKMALDDIRQSARRRRRHQRRHGHRHRCRRLGGTA